MNRLTRHGKKNKDWVLLNKICSKADGSFCPHASICNHVENRTCPFLEVVDRLCEYEDTALEPSEILALKAEVERLRAERRWIPVTERLPESGKHVLLCCEIKPIGKNYICNGYYASQKSITCGCGDEIDCEYDDKTDEYYLLEGFYEVIKNWEEYSSITISDFVTHWMPLPEPPKGEAE